LRENRYTFFLPPERGEWVIRWGKMGESDHTVAPPSPDTSDSAQPRADPALDILTSLTGKQRAVLDLLIEHKTSKEISRLLGISPHTVDQRIMLARAKLGVATRGEVALAYRRLLAEDGTAPSLYEQSVYDFSGVAAAPDERHVSAGDDGIVWSTPSRPRRDALLNGAIHGGEVSAEPYHHVLPEMFDGPYGTYLRLGAIALLTMFLILIVMGGLAMYAQLSQIIDH